MAAIKRKKLADAVLDEIKRMIAAGELKEGDKLPNQNEFSAQLGVSRPSLREALHTLSLIGVIEQRPGLGTVIKSANPSLWLDQLSPPFLSDAEASLELLEARRFIEIGVVELAVQHATKRDIDQIGKLVARMQSALAEERMKRYSELDMAFHEHLAIASHNRYMKHMFLTIRGLMEQFIREAFTAIPDLLKKSLVFHVNIYEGVKDGDLDKAAANMKEHIQDIYASLSDYYE
jgi:GntR family transcriptional regulator, transcriptional repressor for pyruvate dehydrogenase complex